MYLDIRTHTLYIEIRTGAYLSARYVRILIK